VRSVGACVVMVWFRNQLHNVVNVSILEHLTQKTACTAAALLTEEL
jgi:hypothetical protein